MNPKQSVKRMNVLISVFFSTLVFGQSGTFLSEDHGIAAFDSPNNRLVLIDPGNGSTTIVPSANQTSNAPTFITNVTKHIERGYDMFGKRPTISGIAFLTSNKALVKQPILWISSSGDAFKRVQREVSTSWDSFYNFEGITYNGPTVAYDPGHSGQFQKWTQAITGFELGGSPSNIANYQMGNFGQMARTSDPTLQGCSNYRQYGVQRTCKVVTSALFYPDRYEDALMVTGVPSGAKAVFLASNPHYSLHPDAGYLVQEGSLVKVRMADSNYPRTFYTLATLPNFPLAFFTSANRKTSISAVYQTGFENLKLAFMVSNTVYFYKINRITGAIVESKHFPISNGQFNYLTFFDSPTFQLKETYSPQEIVDSGDALHDFWPSSNYKVTSPVYPSGDPFSIGEASALPFNKVLADMRTGGGVASLPGANVRNIRVYSAELQASGMNRKIIVNSDAFSATEPVKQIVAIFRAKQDVNLATAQVQLVLPPELKNNGSFKLTIFSDRSGSPIVTGDGVHSSQIEYIQHYSGEEEASSPLPMYSRIGSGAASFLVWIPYALLGVPDGWAGPAYSPPSTLVASYPNFFLISDSKVQGEASGLAFTKLGKISIYERFVKMMLSTLSRLPGEFNVKSIHTALNVDSPIYNAK